MIITFDYLSMFFGGVPIDIEDFALAIYWLFFNFSIVEYIVILWSSDAVWLSGRTLAGNFYFPLADFLWDSIVDWVDWRDLVTAEEWWNLIEDILCQG